MYEIIDVVGRHSAESHAREGNTMAAKAAEFTTEMALAFAEMAIKLPESFQLVSAGFSKANSDKVNSAIVVKNAELFASVLAKKLTPENLRDERFPAALQELAQTVPHFADLVSIVIDGENKSVQGQGNTKRFIQQFEFELRPGVKLNVKLSQPEI